MTILVKDTGTYTKPVVPATFASNGGCDKYKTGALMYVTGGKNNTGALSWYTNDRITDYNSRVAYRGQYGENKSFNGKVYQNWINFNNGLSDPRVYAHNDSLTQFETLRDNQTEWVDYYTFAPGGRIRADADKVCWGGGRGNYCMTFFVDPDNELDGQIGLNNGRIPKNAFVTCKIAFDTWDTMSSQYIFATYVPSDDTWRGTHNLYEKLDWSNSRIGSWACRAMMDYQWNADNTMTVTNYNGNGLNHHTRTFLHDPFGNMTQPFLYLHVAGSAYGNYCCSCTMYGRIYIHNNG